LAMIWAGAGVLWVAARVAVADETAYLHNAWQTAYLVMAASMSLGVLTVLLSPEPAQRDMPVARNAAEWLRGALVEPFAEFIRRYRWQAAIILGLIAVYRISDVVMGIMANPFYVDMGYTKDEVAAVTKVFGVIMTLLGAFIGGVLSMRLGVMRILMVGAVLSAITNLLFAWLATRGHDLTALVWVISADNLASGIASAAFIAYLSSLTNVNYSATQYALFSSMMLLAPKWLAGFSGVYVDAHGYEAFFTSTALLGAPVLLLVWDLYQKTKNMLTGEEEFLRGEERKQAERRQEVREVLAREFTEDEASEHLERMGKEYLRVCPAELVGRHLEAVHEFLEKRVSGADALVPLVKWLDQAEEGHTEVIVVTWNRERLFSKIAGSFAVAGLNILSASIFTRTDDVVVDTFRVCNERMEVVTHPVDRAAFEKTLTEALGDTEDHLMERIAEVGPTLWQKSVGEAEFPASLRVDQASEPGRTLLHVEAPDRVGLLHSLTRVIADEGMQISGARITTEKGAALDTFVIEDRTGGAITSEDLLGRLVQSLKKVVSP